MNNDHTQPVGLIADSPTKLTEFTHLSSEVKQPIGNFSFSRLFRKNTDSIEASPNHTGSPSNVETSPSHSNDTEPSDYLIVASSSADYTHGQPDNKQVQNEGESSNLPHLRVNRDQERDNRSLSNVLRQISSMRNKRSPPLQPYEDSNFKQYWMPDSNCKECYECGVKFTTFRRRHHCRVCGQIFCSHCCNQAIPGKPLGCSGNLRACAHCCKIVLNYIQTSEHGMKASQDEEEEEEDIQTKNVYLNPASENDLGNRTSLRRKNSSSFWDEEIAQMRYSCSAISSNINFFSADQMSTERKILAQDSAQLRELWIQIQDPVNGLELKGHRHRLRMHLNCIVGRELVDWLLSKDKVNTRAQATAIGQALVDAKFLDSITNSDQLFLDEYALYKPSLSVQIESPISIDIEDENLSTQESQDPSWLKDICPEIDDESQTESGHLKSDEWSIEIVDSAQAKQTEKSFIRMPSSSSSFQLDLNVEENRVTLSKPRMVHFGSHELPAVQAMQNERRRELLSSLDLGVQVMCADGSTIGDEFLKGALSAMTAKKVLHSSEELTSPIGWHSTEQLCVESGEKLAYDHLQSAYNNHEQTLLCQLLSMEGLPLTWSDVILPIVHKVSEMVRPDVKNNNDEMDIRQYVQFKKIPGGSKLDCSIINGVVCTKNIAHKKMRNEIMNPRILILSSPIIYQRQENKFLSLDPLVMQEYSYLKNVVSKISSFEPAIVLVEKTVSRLAQDFLLEQGITLVLNVKPSVSERVARCTQAKIVSSIDAQITRPELGICDKFFVSEHTISKGRTKTLMYFDGCEKHLGCTITLRGASNAELKQVKKIMQFMVYVAYNWRLERSFLMDECALPPALPDELPIMISEDEEFLVKDDDSSSVFLEHRNSQDQLNEDLCDIDQDSVKLKSEETTNEKKASSDDDVTNVLVHNKNLGSSSNLFHYDSQSVGTTESGNDYFEHDTRVSKVESFQVDDFSDPLHSLLHSDDDDTCYRNSGSQLYVASVSFNNSFRKALEDVVLCCSPYIKHSIPYFECDLGRNCELRHYFAEEPYWSVHLHKEKPIVKKKHYSESIAEDIPTYSTMQSGFLSENVMLEPWHPFISQSLTRQFDEDCQMRSLLADFRARGGRIYQLCPHELKEKSKEQKNLENSEMAEIESVNNAGLMWERQVDALDPFYHQRLVALFCSYSPESSNAPNFCVNPKTVCMDFYGNNDITLGGFLERYCFRPSYVCPSSTCSEPMTKHIRKFAHESGCVHIELRDVEGISPVGLHQNAIITWSWCRRCGQVTPLMPMSMDTWSLSFAKYLELRFHGSVYIKRGSTETCSHSLHHDHRQYFEYKQRVVAFKYTAITLREFALPPIEITITETPISHSKIIEEIKHLAVMGNEVYSTVCNWLITMKSCYANTKHDAYFEDMIALQKEDHNVLRERIEEIQVKLTSPTLDSSQFLNETESSISSKDACALMLNISDCVANLKRLIADAAVTWNARNKRMLEFIQQSKKEERPTRLPSVARLISTAGLVPGIDTTSPKSQEDSSGSYISAATNVSQLVPNSDVFLLNSSLTEDSQQNLSPANSMASFLASCEAESIHSEEGDVFRHNDKAQQADDPCRDLPLTGPELTSTPEHLSHSGSDPVLMSLIAPSVELNSTTIISPSKFVEDDIVDTPKIEKKSASVKAILAQILNSTPAAIIKFPFPQNEHYPCDTSNTMYQVPLIVYEDEIGSIIAYTLNSADFEQKLRVAQTVMQRDSLNNSPVVKRKNPRLSERETSSSQTLDVKSLPSSITESGASADDKDLQLYSTPENEKGSRTSNKPGPEFHIDVEFSDPTAKFYCKVYFAKQFQKLRKSIFPQGEEAFIRSLSRCVNWQAKGGKSGSTFSKTHDDRFILKQMSRLELQSFIEFAPHYFKHVMRAFNENKPTVLAKIVGVYRIAYRNNQTTAASKMILLVIENLFYGHNISQKFDLKGSVRNRLVNITGKQEADMVLLDENLLKLTCENPMYIRPHSKTVLTLAINSDTQFLSKQHVMDYSLLVGIDDIKQKLVVGIIDYIRTFTFDKKIEMVVKSSGLLGGQGKKPTILSPEDYRKRFCEAMDCYFLHVSDRWSGLGKGIDS